MNLLRKFTLGISAALALFSTPAPAQNNPFNPDFAWCNTVGSLAVRGPTKWQCAPVGASGQLLQSSGPGSTPIWITPGGGTGTVTSVDATVPAFMSVTGGPIIGAGTLAFSFNNTSSTQMFGRPSGIGAPAFSPLTTYIDNLVTANAQGTLLYRNATSWLGLAPGTGGNVLTTQGAGQNPIWAAPAFPTAAANTIISNITGSSAAPVANSYTNVLDAAISNVRGTLAVRGASNWQALPQGISGQVLQSNGTSADPSWGSGGGIPKVDSVIAGPGISVSSATGNVTISATGGGGSDIAGGRITFVANTPNMGDYNTISTATSVCYARYTSGDIKIYNGTSFVTTSFNNQCQLNSDTTKSPAATVADTIYDMFAWNDAGTIRVTRGPAWTNDTTRSMTITKNVAENIYTNSTTITNGPAAGYGTYVGTIRTDNANTFKWRPTTTTTTGNTIYIWNYYNRITTVQTMNGTANQTVSTAGWVTWNNSATALIRRVVGLQNEGSVNFTWLNVATGSSATCGPQYGISPGSIGQPWSEAIFLGTNKISLTNVLSVTPTADGAQVYYPVVNNGGGSCNTVYLVVGSALMISFEY